MVKLKKTMKKKVLIASIAVTVVIMVVISVLLISRIQLLESRIFCSAYEYNTSNWYKGDKCPVLASYDYGTPNYSTSYTNLGARIFNNNSKSLFNVIVEVSYRTTEDKWNTTKKEMGFLDIREYKQTKITLTNPYLSLWQTKRPDYSGRETTWENVTVYFFNASDYKIVAYGFEKP